MCQHGRVGLDHVTECPRCRRPALVDSDGKLSEHLDASMDRCYRSSTRYTSLCHRRSVITRDTGPWCQRHDPVMRERRRFERAVKDRETYVCWVVKGLTDEELEAAWRQRRADHLVGKSVRFERKLQGRTLEGKITDKMVGGHCTHYVCYFGPNEFLELCVEVVGEPGWLEVTASGARIQVLDD